MNQNCKKLQSALLALAVISTMGAMGMGQMPKSFAELLAQQPVPGGLGAGIPTEDPGKAIARRFRVLRTQVQEAEDCHSDRSVSKAQLTIGGIERLSENFTLTAGQKGEFESLKVRLAMIMSMLPNAPTDPIGDGLGAASASAAEGAGAKPEDAPAGVADLKIQRLLAEIPFFYCEQEYERLAKALRKRSISDETSKRYLDSAWQAIESNKDKPEYLLTRFAKDVLNAAEEASTVAEIRALQEKIDAIDLQHRELSAKFKQQRRSPVYRFSSEEQVSASALHRVICDIQGNIYFANEALEKKRNG